jgi:hypothetical protein
MERTKMQTEKLSTRVNRELFEAIQRAAHSERRSVSNLLRGLVIDFLRDLERVPTVRSNRPIRKARGGDGATAA